MEPIYKHEALENLNAAFGRGKEDDSTNSLETRFLNEAVNFVKDSDDAIIRVIRTAGDGDDEGSAEQTIVLSYKEIKDLSQKEILEEIGRRFNRQ